MLMFLKIGLGSLERRGFFVLNSRYEHFQGQSFNFSHIHVKLRHSNA